MNEKARLLQDFGLDAAPAAAVPGAENLTSAASSVSPLGVAWITTRSPTTRSAAFAGLSTFPFLEIYVVVATSLTSTEVPSAIFTVTESALVFSTVPTTCFLSPCARAAPPRNAKETRSARVRSFIIMISNWLGRNEYRKLHYSTRFDQRSPGNFLPGLL